MPTTRKSDRESRGAQLHPLLHRNESTLRGQLYGSNFSGEEVVWRDHRIAGKKYCVAQRVWNSLGRCEHGLGKLQYSVPAGRLGATDDSGEDGAEIEAELRPESDGRVASNCGVPPRKYMPTAKRKSAGFAEEMVDLKAIQAGVPKRFRLRSSIAILLIEASIMDPRFE